jgi:AraC family transcriptional regulator, transcriptional activator FtrA
MPTIVNPMPKPDAPDIRLTGPLVVAIAYDGLCTFEFGVAAEIFALPRPEMGRGWYRFAVCGVDTGPLRAAGGISVSVDGGMELLGKADLVVVPGWRGILEPVPDRLVHELGEAHRRGARIMSLCSGIVVLCATGLLRGRRATTHWRYLAELSERYPDVALQADVLYVDEGDVLTAAGSAAAIDLCLYVVRKDFGPEAANSVARRLVVPPHRDGGQAQFIETPVLPEREGARFGPLFDWMRERLDQDLTVNELAAKAGMSTRTFQRRFAAATGTAPSAWLLQERLRRARDLLEKGDRRSLDDIAAASGFGSPATMRHHFRERLGTSPAAYRARFNENGG